MISSKIIHFFLVITLLLLLPIIAICQTGEIKGIVKEKGSSEVIPGANIIVKDSNVGASSDFNGEFSIKALKPGKYDLQISFISFKTSFLENIEVVANKTTEIIIVLEQESQLLQTVNIESRVQRDRENILLLEQKKATNIVQQIGAKELSRKGVGDVASAVAKISGISKQEGSNDVYVRGLGDRYNSTSLNGLPIPSNNPEQKNVSLDLFSTDIVEYISIDKVYNNNIYGDFAGGNIDINSKDFTGDRYWEIGYGTNINTTSIDEKAFFLKEGPNYLGLNTLNIPTTIKDYAFENALEPIQRKPIGQSFSISGGNMKRLGLNREINYFTTINFDNNFTSSEGITRSVNNAGIPTKDLRLKKYSYNTNSTAMLNIGFKFNKNNSINYNTLFINSSSNSNDSYEGTLIDIANYDNGLLNRKTYEKNTILTNQFLGSHTINMRSDLKWGISYNSITSDLPDRLQNTFVMQSNGDYFFGQNQITDNHRYFHFLKENETAANLSYSYKILSENADLDYKFKFTIGSSTRYKTRSFNATQFNFRIHTDQRSTAVDPNNLSEFFNQDNLMKGNYFRIETFRGNFQVPFALDPQVYGGTQFIQGTYLTTEYNINKRFTALIGLRSEIINQMVEWNTQLDPTDKEDILDFIGFLPSLTTRYVLTEKQNLRFGASKTYTLPQFKERAMFIYEEVTQVKLGNPDLYQSENYNVDLKWEFFPKFGEIISICAFGKYIINPINEVTISSATNDISFLNTGDWGSVTGIEFEARKELFSINESKLLAGFNTAYMNTNQELNSEKVKEETIYMVNFTHDEARFTGASDLLVNADISFQQNWNNLNNNFIATISFGYVSDKVYALGTNGRGNIIDKAYNTLDFIVKTSLNNLSFGLSIKNILNPSIESYQANENADVIVLSYKKGINMSFSLSYKF